MKVDISKEIEYRTARSGGKGGQNVNKVETMVEGYWHIEASSHLSDEQKALVLQHLSARINRNGRLMARSQSDRTQLGNKALVREKMNEWVNKAIQPKKLELPPNQLRELPSGAWNRKK